MATIKTRYTLGDTIQFIDGDGKPRREIVCMIETQLVEGYDLWFITDMVTTCTGSTM
ncbi:hypothetical protein NC796_04695 [Aliifodinibius sp. S!AR15-10]|uniref:hypothetical protein n=1 Tax=Aliifodinibius sp. S!AR15-10 TaxID=2950437 RepID=UPI0028629CA8|nr:hypothetical protein [Aliifodinibius sp. S!AR15-10]MDR8390429.1 hypothetical protein [Aliifodinibius sp. S!AR15-10]